MAPELTTKIRLVRCPKCRNLLAEVPDLQVYRCGGCNAILQAKTRINGMRSKCSSLNETVAAQKIGLDHVSKESRKSSLDQSSERDRSKSLEGIESGSSIDKPTFRDSGECISDQNNEKNEDKLSEDKECSSSIHNAIHPDSGECALNQNNERDQSQSSEGGECSSSSTPKSTFPDLGDCFSHQNDEKSEDKSSEDIESSSSSHIASPSIPGECFSDQNNERHPSKSSEGGESGSSIPKAAFPDLGEIFMDETNERDRSKSSEDIGSSSSSHNASPSISGECFSDQNNERHQSKSSEGGESSSSSPKAGFPDPGERFMDEANERDQSKSSEDIESTSSSHNASPSISGECFSDQNNERHLSKSSEGNESISTRPKAAFPDLGERFTDKTNERDQSKSLEGCESCSSSPKATFSDSGEGVSDQNNERDQHKYLEGNGFSSSSPKATYPDSQKCFSEQRIEKSENKSPEDKEFGSANHKGILPGSAEWTSNQSNGRDAVKSSEECHREQLGDISVPNEDPNKGSYRNEVSNGICSSTEFGLNKMNESLPTAARAGSEVSVKDESSPLAEADVEVDIKKKIESDFRSSTTVTAHVPARYSISSDSLISSPDEQLVEPHNRVPIGFDQMRSPDAFESTEFNPSSEFSGAHRGMSKSPVNRSHHAYDASVSSMDGMDDQFFNRIPRSKFVHSEERARRDKFLVNRGDSGLQHQGRDSWSSLSSKNDHAMKYRNWDQVELQQPRRQGNPYRDWKRLQSDEYMSRMAFPPRVSQIGHENGVRTNQLLNEYLRNSGYQSSDKSVDPEPNKMQLLRMVYELQDQVNNLNGKASGRVAGGATWKESRIPQYRSYEASEDEHYHDPNYQRYLRRHRAGSHYPSQHRKPQRIPFSSEAPTSRHQADPSYMRRGPQDWQCSAPLPLPVRCSNNGVCRVHPGHNCWASCASSPERYAESEFPVWGHETMSEGLKHRRHDVKNYLREKHYMGKRHFRPIAGGAPIITCYNCLNVLQIPADFLLFKRKIHRLKCGACSEVLKFSLQKGCHILPYEQTAIAPPPSEAGDYNAAVNGRFESQDADPVSCSDDYGYGYGLSFSRSYSTEGDPGPLAPSNSLRGNSDDRNMTYSSLDQMRERKELALKQSQNKDKNPVETYVSARPSMSSEIEELPPKSTSPLYQLMDYSSPSQVIRGSGSSSHTGTSSYSRLR